MDLLIGGIPRSGTTALARAIELHPSIFCWSTETGLLPFVGELTQGLPMRPENLTLVTKSLLRHLFSAIVDQESWRRQRGSNGRNVSVSEAAIEGLATELAQTLAQHQPGKESLRRCSGVLRHFLAQYSDRSVVAEKSPSNILLFEESPDLANKWLMTHREPFATIFSMHEKAKADPYSEILTGPIERRIGLYNLHARSITNAASTATRAMTVSLDQLNSDPCGTMARVCMFLRVEPTLSYLEAVRSIIGTPVTKDSWQAFSPLERWKIMHLCGHEMRALGYDGSYYRAPMETITRNVPLSIDAQVEPLYGIYPATTGKLQWVQRRASVAVYAPKGFNTLCFTVFSNVETVSAAIAELGVSIGALTVTAFSSNSSNELTEIGSICLANYCNAEWRLALSEQEPVGEHGSWRLYRIELETNFAFTPCYSLPEHMDERTISFAVYDYRLEP